MMAKELINIDPELMGGTPVFRGTRVPVRHLLNLTENGATTDEFISGFPSVTKEQVVAFLELMHGSILSELLETA